MFYVQYCFKFNFIFFFNIFRSSIILAHGTYCKGNLLQGLVKQKTQNDHPNVLSVPQDTSDSITSHYHKRVEDPAKGDDEPCPICHEKLSNQKMVFQCGHVTCCKCKNASAFVMLFLCQYE